ncbi:MAG: copper homeostasis periplasmic binding protein CopC [Alphaproteobacteria bacterium]|nr:copper homeostasis periplasmic binding protein CopC [Alphaproteobacteria bacterium]
MFDRLSRFCVLAVFATFASVAQAHSHLQAAEPAVDAVVQASPPALKLTFSMKLVAKFSGVKLLDSKGNEVPLGAAPTDPANNKILIVPVPAPLAAGEYTVDWHVVAVDTHRMKGTYKFTIKP